MTKNAPAPKTATRKVPAHKLPYSGRLQAHYGIDDQTLRIQKLNEIASLLLVPEGVSQKDKLERTVRALELYESLAPADGAEGMLAVQLVVTHDTALVRQEVGQQSHFHP